MKTVLVVTFALMACQQGATKSNSAVRSSSKNCPLTRQHQKEKNECVKTVVERLQVIYQESLGGWLSAGTWDQTPAWPLMPLSLFPHQRNMENYVLFTGYFKE